MPRSERAPSTQSLSEADLTRLLAAELYGYQGNLEESLRYYLEAARSTRDLAVLRRGTYIALHARDDEYADRFTRMWLAVDDEDLEVRRHRVRMELRAGDESAARRHLEYILKWAGENDLGNILLALTASFSGAEEHAAAFRVLQGLEDRHLRERGVARALLDILTQLMVPAEQRPAARRLALHLVTLAPRAPEAAIAYAGFLIQGEQYEAVLTWLENYMDEEEAEAGGQPPHLELSMLRAQQLYRLERRDEAIVLLEALEKEYPRSSELFYRLGLLYMTAGKDEQARRYLLRASEDEDYRDRSYYYLAEWTEQQGDLEEARRYYEQVRGGHLLPHAQARAIYLTGGAGQFNEARLTLRALSQRYWNFRESRNLFINTEAQLLIDAERYEEALTLYEEALEKLDYDPELLYRRAMMADRLGRLEQLEQALRSILEREPEHVEALNALGYTLADRTQRYQEAYQLISRALSLSKEQPAHIIDSMGWVLYRLDRLEEALSYLSRAYEKHNDVEIAAHLGEVLWQLGQREKALLVWREALSTDPGHELLLRVMRRFAP